MPSPYHRSDVVADAGAGATSAQCVDRAVEQGSGRPKSCGLYRATEIARIFGRTVRRSSLRDISPLTVLSFVASLADRAGRGGEVRADCGRGHRPGPGSVCLVDAPSLSPPGSTPNWSACSTAPPSTSPTRCRDEPTMRKAFASPPVAEIVAHSGDGIVDKGAEASRDGEATYCVLRRNVEHSELGCAWRPMPDQR